MNPITLVEFRKNTEGILQRVQRGERFVLTRRGRCVARLEPMTDAEPGLDDSIYRLAELAIEVPGSMTNREIDRIVYGV